MMKCPYCVAANETSTVFVGGGTTTLMYAPPFYDEEGVYHDHDPNVTSSRYTCSKGHAWMGSTKKRCPAPGCDYGEEEKVV